MYGRKTVNEEKLLKKIAKLESMCDQLQAEMKYLDTLLVKVGFEEGLKTLKSAALELIEKNDPDKHQQ